MTRQLHARHAADVFERADRRHEQLIARALEEADAAGERPRRLNGLRGPARWGEAGAAS